MIRTNYFSIQEADLSTSDVMFSYLIKDFFTVRMFTKAITNSEKPRSIHLKSKSIEGDWYIDQDMPRLTGQSLKVFRDKLDLYDSNLLDNFKSIGKSDEDIKDLMDVDDAELRLIKERFQNFIK